MASVAVATALAIGSAQAAVIDWANWSNTFTAGNPAGGSATATVGGNTATYSGQLIDLIDNYPSWGPPGTFNGGNVGNPPPVSGGIIQLFGGNAGINTITFGTAVTNPVMAIWSLGQGGTQASFKFLTSPFFIQSGGPSNEYGGVPLTTLLVAVLGSEGNGTIQFIGTYNSISWVNPVFENWYGFTVGAPTPVPVPAALPLFATILAGGGLIAWRKKRKAAKAATH